MRARCVAGRRFCQAHTTAQLAVRHATTSALPLHTSTPAYTSSLSLEHQVARSALIAQRLCSLHYVQRLLRRLPSATHTDTLLYLNELPANLRDDLIRLALYKLHEEHTGKDEAQAKVLEKNKDDASMQADALQRLLMLRGPRASIAEHKIHNYLRSLPRSRRAEGQAHEADAQPPTLLLPRTEAQYAALGLHMSTPTNSASDVCVQLRSASGADRVDYRDSPLVYVMVVPSNILDNVQGSATVFVQRCVVYDEDTQQLLLQHSHHTPRHADDARTCNDRESGADDVFFAQCYNFDPHAALALAQQLNNTPDLSTTSEGEVKATQPPYRVLYLIACKEEQAVDARWPNAHSTAHSHAEEHVHGVALCDVAALFPSSFVSSVAELRTYTSSSSNKEEARDAMCVPMRLKKLCYERGAAQNSAHTSSQGSEDVSLWSTQIAPSASDDDVHAVSDLSAAAAAAAAEHAVPLQKEDMQYLKHVLTRAREQALRAAHGEVGTSYTENTKDEGNKSCNRCDAASRDTAAHAAQDEGYVRHRRVSFTVVEVTPHTTPAALPRSDTTRCALLAPTLWRLLYRTASSFTQGTSSSSSHSSSSSPSHNTCDDGVVPTALDDLMTARERLLLPFLRRPRQLPRRFFANTRTTSSVKGSKEEKESNNSKGKPFVPVLWSIAELEQLLGWYTMRHLFADRYGPLRNLLSPELYVSIGDGLVKSNAHDEDDDDVWQMCEASTSSSSSPSSSSCFVLVQDLAFVKQVLLPAMHRYSTLHRTCFTAHTNNAGSGSSLSGYTKTMRAALEVHQTRLAGWLQVLQDGSDAQLQSWLRLTPPHVTTSSAAVQTRMPAPRQSRAFFVGAEGNEVAAVRRRLQRRFAVVPIQPFLMWATQPPSLTASHKDKDVKGEEEEEEERKECVFSSADLVRCLQYFLTYPAYFELTGGDGTTVAVSLPD